MQIMYSIPRPICLIIIKQKNDKYFHHSALLFLHRMEIVHLYMALLLPFIKNFPY